MNKRSCQILAILALLALGVASASAADSSAGKGVFDKKCKTCHGATGEGNPGMAKALKADIKPLSSPEIQSKSDADLKQTITQGKGKMKPVAGLSDSDIENVIAYVHTLKK